MKTLKHCINSERILLLNINFDLFEWLDWKEESVLFQTSCLISLVASAGHYKHDGDDKAVKGESLGEDHHKDQSNKDILLSVGSYTSIANHANSQACGKGWKSTAKAGGKLLVAEGVVVCPRIWLLNIFIVGNGLDLIRERGSAGLRRAWIKRKVWLTGAWDDDGDNEAVDTEDTGHDDGDDRLDDQLGLEDCHRADAHAGLRGTVGRAHVTKNERAHDAHPTEEKSLVGVSVDCTCIGMSDQCYVQLYTYVQLLLEPWLNDVCFSCKNLMNYKDYFYNL